MANFKIIHEVPKSKNAQQGDWVLYFQFGEYRYSKAEKAKGFSDTHGYRFIWRTSDGKLQASRGQARIPSIAEALALISEARKDGWGDEEHKDRK